MAHSSLFDEVEIDENTRINVPKRYQELKKIGNGAQGMVFGAIDIITKSGVAIKKLTRPFSNVLAAKRAYREFVVMHLANHKNVIRLLNAYTPQQSVDLFIDVYLVMELMEADLGHVVQMSLDQERVSFLLYQMLCGILHLHSAGIIHRDLKPHNILVDQFCNLKITDFGLARETADSLMMTPYVVTRYYRAPEVVLPTGIYDEKGIPRFKEEQPEVKKGNWQQLFAVDVWSIGCIFVEMITHRVLFRGENYLDQWTKITDIVGSPDESFINRIPIEMPYIITFVKQQPFKKQIPWERVVKDNEFPPSNDARLNPANARDLISKMLILNPDARLSVIDALSHPYVHLWYDPKEVISSPRDSYDTSLEEKELTIDEWKKTLFETVKKFEATHDVFGLNHHPPPNQVNGSS